ncbi:MAG: hypothetical protein HY904_09620 [Deltaproteobacteria bacterium]|nr:hypothetical protein [Deltaproteobacteria bacterium]
MAISAWWGLAAVLGAAEPGPPVTTATADGKGTIAVHLVYFAEHTCMAFSSVREGHPPSIDPPRRTPTVTVVLDREAGSRCEQKLKRLEQVVSIADRPGALSVEVLYVDKTGRFIRSSRPPIARPGDDQEIQ